MVTPKASLPVSKHHLGSMDLKGLELHYGSLDFKHLLLRALAHCIWDKILAPAGGQAFRLNSNGELNAAGFVYQFPQQTQIAGLCPQSSRVSTKGEHSFTGVQGDGYTCGQVRYMNIYLYFHQSLIHSTNSYYAMPPPGCLLGQMREESDMVLSLRTLNVV